MTFKYIHPWLSQLLLVACYLVTTLFLSNTVLDTTTFEMDATACDLENSFIIDNDA